MEFILASQYTQIAQGPSNPKVRMVSVLYVKINRGMRTVPNEVSSNQETVFKIYLTVNLFWHGIYSLGG